MYNNFVHIVHFKQMKALHDAFISFEDTEGRDRRVTGIFGPNGYGKSTILHALACIFRPTADGGESHRFSDFFKYDKYQNWDGTAFDVDHSYSVKGVDYRRSIAFAKPAGRWMRDYDSRHPRPVFYIGIRTCIPDIEVVPATLLRVNLHGETDMHKDVAKAASVVMCDRYYTTAKSCGIKHNRIDKLIVVDSAEAGKHSSLNLGAGEQRLFRVVNTLLNAPKYSLVLIDELDLTLHTAALHRLVDKIVEIAQKNKLQVIFTSHREELLTRKDINIRHIFQTDDKTLVFDASTSECLYRLPGKQHKPLDIFVEDNYAKQLVEQVAIEEGVKKCVNVHTFGDASNAFNVGIGLLLKGENLDNVLIVLDGDVYKTREQRLDMLKRYFSGDEADKDQKRQAILDQIRQFCLPAGTPPEKFLHDLLCASANDTELTRSAKAIAAVADSHEYISRIVNEMDMSEDVVINQIVHEVAQTKSWHDYTSEIRDWLCDRKAALHL